MADRTLCDSTKISQRLALLSAPAYSLYPYIFQETDDYGRMDTNPVLIKSQRFPLISWVTPELIESALQEYNHPLISLLFFWEFDGHRFGYFVNFEARSGKYLSRRRKSIIPVPSGTELATFLKNRSNLLKDNNQFKTLQTLQNSSYKLSQVKLSKVKLSKKEKDKRYPDKSGKLSTSQQQEKISHLTEGIFKPVPKTEKQIDWTSPYQVWMFYNPGDQDKEKSVCKWLQLLKNELKKKFPEKVDAVLIDFIKQVHTGDQWKDKKAGLVDMCKDPLKYMK